MEKIDAYMIVLTVAMAAFTLLLISFIGKMVKLILITLDQKIEELKQHADGK